MAHCAKCGKKLGFLASLSGKKRCDRCEKTLQAILFLTEKEIESYRKLSDDQVSKLSQLDRDVLIDLYGKVYHKFEQDKELDDKELQILQKFQERFELSSEEIKYDERILPYLYVREFRKEGRLPIVKRQPTIFSKVILKKGEVIHYAHEAILKEMRKTKIGYSGGSQGVSIRLAKGVRYRVGAHRGHIMTEDTLVETSRGELLITNKRLLLQPLPHNKPVNLPLKKVLSYQCYQNGLDVYKESREKGYFFEIDSAGAVEIIGLCLSILLSNSD